MKTFNLKLKLNAGLLIILIFAMSLCSTKTFGLCHASFTFSQTANNVVNFTNTSTGTTIQTFYNWSFGDGNYDYTQSPGSHTYTDSGTYIVCLYINDSSNSCFSSYCDTIHVYGVLICTMTATTYEDSMATCSTCADGGAIAYGYGGTLPYSYLWSNGATTYNIANALPGTYTCCITDAYNCSACSTVTIDTCGLHAGYTWYQPSNNIIDFTNTSTGTDTMTSYSWNFGDNNYDNGINPVHTYDIPGTYTVCLTITNYNTNSSTCNSTFCNTITVTGVIICNLTVNTYEDSLATCSTCPDGSAYAYISGGTPPYTYHWSNGDTSYYAPNLIPGTYTCCVTDANNCTACTIVIITYCNLFADFSWIQPSNNIVDFTNTSTGTDTMTTYSWSFGDNNYDYTPSPVHTYSIPGTYTVCLTINNYNTNSSTCSSYFCDTITVTGVVMCNMTVYTYQDTLATCSTCADGSAYAYVYGGTPPYTYLWSNGNTNQIAYGLLPGTYTCCVTDTNNCTVC